ncbi:hypothetical protein [Haladaptatus caseinilyticus]|uniref:hypothetical protein n=1 Tax=Haladaptatus caseinilyticus TaxID=2993314 RepID=UPI00224AB2A9|nr:hypothetical protein [Haladaptatus caseinilyticus]
MSHGLDFDITETDRVAEERDAVVSAVTQHAGEIARELALLQGGDYGQTTLETNGGEWTLKYEAGDIQYLRFKGNSGGETYVVSSKQPPDPEDLADAMRDYEAFVRAYNRYVGSKDGVLDDVSTDFPPISTTESVVAERDRIVGRIRDIADTIAGELHRYDGVDYGTFTTRVSGQRWELKRDHSSASYLRVGGQSGTYLVSQYEPPSAPDVRELADDFRGFVEAYNDHVDELEADLSKVTL